MAACLPHITHASIYYTDVDVSNTDVDALVMTTGVSFIVITVLFYVNGYFFLNVGLCLWRALGPPELSFRWL